MIYILAGLLTNKISKYNFYSEEEIEKIDYALKALFSEGFKLVILFLIFFFYPTLFQFSLQAKAHALYELNFFLE